MVAVRSMEEILKSSSRSITKQVDAWRVNEGKSRHVGGYFSPRPKDISLLVCLIAVLLPFLMVISVNPITGTEVIIQSMLWIYQSNTNPNFVLNLSGLLTTFATYVPVFLFRYWFVYEVYRFYDSRVSKNHALTIGGIAELSIIIPWLLLGGFSLEYYFSIIPLPVLLFVVYAIMTILPPANEPNLWEREC